MVWGAVIGAGASLLGGMMSNSANKKRADATNSAQVALARESNAQQADFFDQNMDFNQRVWDQTQARYDAQFDRSMYESDRAYSMARNQNAANRRDQYNFAKNSTGWQFDDLMQSADQSGIHRLAALGGASAAQYSPVQGQAPISGAPAVPHGPNASSLPSTTTANLDTAFMGDIIGPAVNQAIQAYQTDQSQQLQAERNEIGKASAAAEIQESQARAELYTAQSRSLLAKARQNDDPVTQGVTNSAGSPGRQASSQPAQTTTVTVDGKQLPHDSSTDDASRWSDRWGELGEIIGALVVGQADYKKSETYKKIKRNMQSLTEPQLEALEKEVKSNIKKPKKQKPKAKRKPYSGHPNPHFRR